MYKAAGNLLDPSAPERTCIEASLIYFFPQVMRRIYARQLDCSAESLLKGFGFIKHKKLATFNDTQETALNIHM